MAQPGRGLAALMVAGACSIIAIAACRPGEPDPISAWRRPPTSSRGGTASADLLTYTPISPCRIVDTREQGGAFAENEFRSFSETSELMIIIFIHSLTTITALGYQ